MRLVTYRDGSTSRAGLLRGQEVTPLGPEGSTVLDLPLGEGERLRELVHGAGAPLTSVSEVELLAPVPVPRRNVFATGWNYFDHFEEGRAAGGHQVSDVPAHPTFFTKTSGCVVGPRADIAADSQLSVQLDYEAEVAVVIGRGGRSIPSEKAWDHVLGLTLANDVSVRDVQRQHGGQWFKGKSIDGTCPLGPAIVSLDEIDDLAAVQLSCHVNGELRQHASLAQMAFSIPRIIEELSHGMSLLAGDVILTGTPAGVGYARQPASFLRPGDEVVVAATGLGELRNHVVAADLSSYVAY